MKQVLYITYDGLTDPLGQSQILPYVIGLSKRGYQFTLISCEKPEKFESGKTLIESICIENGIDWHPLIYHKKPPVVSTIRDALNIRKLAFKLHRKKSFSIVHCRSYISALVGLEIKRKKGVPFIFDMRGFFADERIDGGLWHLSNPVYKIVYKFFKSKEAAYVQFSDAIISLTEAGKRVIMSWPTMQHSKKITVIPCSVDMTLFDRKSLDKTKMATLKKEMGDDLIIGYYGSLGTWYMMEEMLDLFGVIKKKHNSAKLMIITKDKWETSHQLLVNKKQINPADIIIKSSERNEMPYYMAITDIGIFFIKPCFSKLASSPTKHGEMMSIGLPLIANSGVGDVDEIVTGSQSGLILHEFNTQAYEKAVEAIPHLLNMDPEAIRNSCTNIYSLEIALDKYYQVYQSIEKKTS